MFDCSIYRKDEFTKSMLVAVNFNDNCIVFMNIDCIRFSKSDSVFLDSKGATIASFSLLSVTTLCYADSFADDSNTHYIIYGGKFV